VTGIGLRRMFFRNMARILILDDDYTILQLFQYVFQDAGYVVKTATNGKTALELLKDYRPDFMIVDIAMPEMDGWAFITELNKAALRNTGLKGIPYVVMTGENFLTQSKRFSFERGKNFKKYFIKMTNPEIILDFVNGNMK